MGTSPTRAAQSLWILCFAFQNMPNVRDHDASVYLRLQGDALSVGGYEANPIFWEEVRPAPQKTPMVERQRGALALPN